MRRWGHAPDRRAALRRFAGVCARYAIAAAMLLCTAPATRAAPPVYPVVTPGHAITFPRDFGAHPEFRTEWWYVTGQLTTRAGKRLGFQVTFFRSRPDLDEANPSRFAPRQILFAHAAVSDPAPGRLMHDQRVAREGFGLAQASVTDTDVAIGAWSLVRAGGAYRAAVVAREFELRLAFTPTQAVMRQGEAGFSRKGPLPTQASYYLSEPQLSVAGTVTRGGKVEDVTGKAWLDHEWSTAYLARDAAGWDWAGINLDDGGALMLFQIRHQDGRKLWAGGTLRRADGTQTTFGPADIEWLPQRRWRSPRTQTDYPVALRVRAGDLTLDLQPLMDDQELDSRASTGAIYWEGAVEVRRAGRRVGEGYLELTGYAEALQM